VIVIMVVVIPSRRPAGNADPDHARPGERDETPPRSERAKERREGSGKARISHDRSLSAVKLQYGAVDPIEALYRTYATGTVPD
jgi:hypothetical protein